MGVDVFNQTGRIFNHLRHSLDLGGHFMYKMKESEDRLNQHAVMLFGKDISFRVYYWGINSCHYDNPLHKHSFFEICYVMDGLGVYAEKDAEYALRKGTFFCSRPGVVHQIRSKTGLKMLHVAFEVIENQTTFEETQRFQLLSKGSEVCIQSGKTAAAALLWKTLLIPESQKWALRNDHLSLIAHTLISSLPDLFLKHRHQEKQTGHRTNVLLQQAKLYIRDNLDQPLSLETVSAYLHVSQRHLSRLFTEGIHESFNRFVRQERINKAVYILGTTDLSIKEIAIKTGFSSVHSFTRTFTSEQQIPPGKYRQMITRK
jgi:AraC-like DNA-binding protein/mannose-6-phosphate isomerase-like protein (cupin superfamily)